MPGILEAQGQGAQVYGAFVRTWYDRFMTVAESFGAEVMSEEGDAISLFFDEAENKHELPRLITALQDMVATHKKLTTDFGLEQDLHLRAALVYGQIQPCWKGSGSVSRAGWDGNILIHVARTLELERQVPGNENRSVLVVDAGLIQSEMGLSRLGKQHAVRLLERSLCLPDKDKKVRKIAAIDLTPSSAGFSKDELPKGA